jgi:hypothetical protein
MTNPDNNTNPIRIMSSKELKQLKQYRAAVLMDHMDRIDAARSKLLQLIQYPNVGGIKALKSLGYCSWKELDADWTLIHHDKHILYTALNDNLLGYVDPVAVIARLKFPK